MAYFNHAFCKAFIIEGNKETDTTKTSAFDPMDWGLVDGVSWEADAPGDIQTAGNHAYFVQGSVQTNDSIGNNPGHGGYTESVKSKGINLRYVTRLGRAKSAAATASTSTICLGSTCAPCGENFFMRVDVKGSPALRFLNHNAYAVGDSSGDAAANGGSLPDFLCCTSTQTHVDPAAAGAAAAQMLLADPIIKPFVQEGNGGNVATLTLSAGGSGYTTASAVATTGGSGTGLKVDTTVAAGAIASAVINANNGGRGYKVGDIVDVAGGTGGKLAVATVAAGGVVVSTTAVPYKAYTIAEILDGSSYTASNDPVTDGVTACITFEGAYASTRFGDCSFDTRDFWDKEPVQITTSVLDMTGNPCNTCGTVTNTPGTMAQTSGEQAIRDLILSDAYMQSPYNQGNADSARIREIEGSDKLLAAIERDSLYWVYYLQHSVPRFNNPTGVFDNDQYLYKIYVKSDDTDCQGDMDALWDAIKAACVAVGNDVKYDNDL